LACTTTPVQPHFVCSAAARPRLIPI
jgi:hypothetical protein